MHLARLARFEALGDVFRLFLPVKFALLLLVLLRHVLLNELRYKVAIRTMTVSD